VTGCVWMAISPFLTPIWCEFDTQQVPEDLLFVLGAPIPLESVSAAGNQLTRAPELSLFASLQYALDLGKDFEGLLELAWRYQDEVFFLETNQGREHLQGRQCEPPGPALCRPSVSGALGGGAIRQ
jgi:hypothetical protein